MPQREPMIADGIEQICGYADVALRSHSEKSARTYFFVYDAYEA